MGTSDDDLIVVNAGDLIQRWTNDRWVSNVHRVVNREIKEGEEELISIVYFTGPHDDTEVTMLPSPYLEGQAAKYPPTSAGAHLMEKIMASN